MTGDGTYSHIKKLKSAGSALFVVFLLMLNVNTHYSISVICLFDWSFSCHRPHEENGQTLDGHHDAHRVEDAEGRQHEDPASQGRGGQTANPETCQGNMLSLSVPGTMIVITYEEYWGEFSRDIHMVGSPWEASGKLPGDEEPHHGDPTVEADVVDRGEEHEEEGGEEAADHADDEKSVR